MTDPIVETIRPDDPSLAVKLKVLPPVVGKTYSGDPKHGDWTLDLVERTCLELRAAGAWDGSKVGFNGYPEAMTCEVLAGRGADAMPWGWRPSEGPPQAAQKTSWRDQEVRHAIPAFLGNRVLHGVLLLALVLLAVIER